MNPYVDSIVKSFDERSTPFSELDVLSAINATSAIVSATEESAPFCLVAEGLAFHLVENCADREGLWGKYYGPAAIGEDKNGDRIDIPPISAITDDVISYWEERAGSASHPILRARYADLVWEFSSSVRNSASRFRMAQIVVDANLEIALRQLHRVPPIIPIRLRRALDLAISTNDRIRVERVRLAVLSQLNEPFSREWGNLYNELLRNPRSQLANTERDAIIVGLRAQLDDICRDPASSITQVSMLTLWLAEVYRRTNQPLNTKIVLDILLNSILDRQSAFPALTLLAHLENLFEVLRRFGFTNEARNLIEKIEEVSMKSRDEMVGFRLEFPLPDVAIHELIQEIVGDSLELALRKLACFFAEDFTEAQKQLRELTQVAPLSYQIRNSHVNERGMATASVLPIEQDNEGHIVQHMGTCMKLCVPILRSTIVSMRAKFSPSVEQLLEVLYQSPLYQENRKPIIRRGLEAYWDDEDFVVSIHLFIPQLEHAIRELAKQMNITTYKEGRRGGFQLRNLDELLRLVELEEALGKRTTVYLRTLLSDQRGWNLRNEISHGIPACNGFTVDVADRLFHALLLLSLVRFDIEQTDNP